MVDFHLILQAVIDSNGRCCLVLLPKSTASSPLTPASFAIWTTRFLAALLSFLVEDLGHHHPVISVARSWRLLGLQLQSFLPPIFIHLPRDTFAPRGRPTCPCHSLTHSTVVLLLRLLLWQETGMSSAIGAFRSSCFPWRVRLVPTFIATSFIRSPLFLESKELAFFHPTAR